MGSNSVARRIERGLLGAGVLLVALDLFPHKHAHFDAENWFGFYGLFGLAAGLALAVLTRLLRGIVHRDESYYS